MPTLENYGFPSYLSHVRKIRAASAGDFSLLCLIWIWLVHWSRHLVIYW
jgi:hypothetical protein